MADRDAPAEGVHDLALAGKFERARARAVDGVRAPNRADDAGVDDGRADQTRKPTRGLDVGACEYVYDQLRGVRDRGGGVLLVSEDIDELLLLADRIVVLFSGRVIGALPATEATPDWLGLMMTGQALAS